MSLVITTFSAEILLTTSSKIFNNLRASPPLNLNKAVVSFKSIFFFDKNSSVVIARFKRSFKSSLLNGFKVYT